MSNKTTQCDRVLSYIKEFGEITQLEALRDLGCMRLASRISDLKRRGVPIVSNMRAVRNRYGERCAIAVYSLANENAAAQ